jgi:hypothetical protein
VAQAWAIIGPVTASASSRAARVGVPWKMLGCEIVQAIHLRGFDVPLG